MPFPRLPNPFRRRPHLPGQGHLGRPHPYHPGHPSPSVSQHTPRIHGGHGSMHGDLDYGYFGADGDDPIGDGLSIDSPTVDLSVPDRDPWGMEVEDLVDEDFDPNMKSGRVGRRQEMKYLEGGFGFEDIFYAGFGPAPLIGHEGHIAYPVKYGTILGCEDYGSPFDDEDGQYGRVSRG